MGEFYVNKIPKKRHLSKFFFDGGGNLGYKQFLDGFLKFLTLITENAKWINQKNHMDMN